LNPNSHGSGIFHFPSVVKHLALEQGAIDEHQELDGAELRHLSFANLGPVIVRLGEPMQDAHWMQSNLTAGSLERVG